MKRLTAVAVIVGLAACGGDGGSSPSGSTPATTTPPATSPPQPTEVALDIAATDVPKQIGNLATLESLLVVSQTGTIVDISIDVNIEHTWRGDLEIALQHPDGTVALLFAGVPGDSADNVVQTFTRSNAGELSRMLNKTVTGTWKLSVTDRAPQDKGVLANWVIHARVRR